jgi:hypothetical protein
MGFGGFSTASTGAAGVSRVVMASLRTHGNISTYDGNFRTLSYPAEKYVNSLEFADASPL